MLCLLKTAEGLLGGCQLSSVLQSDVTFALSKMEMEASSKSLIEMISCLDLQMVTVWGLSSSAESEDLVKVRCVLMLVSSPWVRWPTSIQSFSLGFSLLSLSSSKFMFLSWISSLFLFSLQTDLGYYGA